MERVFYSVLERVGTEGRYQVISQMIHCLYLLIAGASTFFNAFLFHEMPYECPNLAESACNTYVCGLPQAQRQSFINPAFSSFSTKFGDHRCDDGQLDRIQSFIYLGGIVGVIVGTYISQVLTKRTILISCVVVNIVGMLIALLAPTLIIAAMGLFLNFASKCIEMEIGICYITESIGESIRPKYIILCYIAFGLAATFNGLVFRYLDWQLAIILYIILPLIISLLGLIFYMKETPFDMITNYTPEESLVMLRDIAHKNGIQTDLTVQQIAKIKDQYDQNQKEKEHLHISILDLFKYDSLRTIVIFSILLHFISSFQFNAPELALKNYELDVYLNGIIIGISQVIACIFSYFTISHQERKKGLLITQAISFGIAVLTVLFASCPFTQCTTQKKILQSIGLFAFRLVSTVAYNFFYMIQYEIFPNQVRGIALQTTAIASYTAVFITPMLMSFCIRTGISIIIFYAISCIFAILFTLKLRQTFGQPPPEIIEQLQYDTKGMESKKIKEG